MMRVTRKLNPGHVFKSMAFVLFAVYFFSAEHALANNKYAAMVVDHHTGKVIFSRHADSPRYPASLTKIMTLYLLFDEISAGRVKLSDRVTMTPHAASMPPSKLGIKAGGTIRVEDAIRALVTKSANDVAAAVGAHIAGTEAAFAKKMTRKARSLGMRRTTFKNASGLPDSRQTTTARDMITLSRAIMTNHPRYYRYFSTKSFRYKGKSYRNHNKLLRSHGGVDGIKTGYTRASGFNLTTSMRRKNRHVVAVVMGGKTGRSRDQHMAALLSRHLPKAVVRRSPPRVPPGVQVAAQRVPVPTARPERAGDPIATTILMATNSKLPAVAGNEPTRTRAVRTTEIIVARASPAPRPEETIRLPVPQQPIGEGDLTSPDDQAVLPDLPKGWAIQIGAVASVTEAMALIKKAKTNAPGATAGRVPFTEKTVKNGTTYIRTRFAGFETPGEAKAACAVMKKKGFGCFRVSL